MASVIREVYNGISPIDVLLEDYRMLKEEKQLSVLSPSEKEIFDLIQKGFQRNEIPEMLCKSENTVKSQIKSIIRKFDASCVSEVIKKVKSKGLWRLTDKNIRNNKL